MAENAPEMSPSEAFSLVANDTRFAILEALWEGTRTDDDALAFSSLREAAGVRDSGQFNYHLDQLTPRFVRQAGDGYELTYAGEQVVGAAVSGVYTEAETRQVEPMPAGTCPECGGTIEAGYRRGHIAIECADCEVVVTDLPAPPVLAAGYPDEELPAVFSRRLVTTLIGLNRGFCDLCGGRVDRSLEALPYDRFDEAPPGARYECRACGRSTRAVVGAVLVDHPAVVSFVHDHGVDLWGTPFWELDWLLDPTTTVASEAPLRLEARFALEGDELRVVLDEALQVLDWSRSDADATGG